MDRIERIAAAAHEANRIFCEAHGDTSQQSWHVAPKWQQQSAIRGVSVALGGATPAQQHEAWMRDKLADGWVFGPIKDPEAKTHPCLVPYEELPEMQRRKDALYIAVVKAMSEALA